MSERVDQRLEVVVGVILEHEGERQPCMSHAVSPRGMFVATKRPVPKGSIVGLEIVHDNVRIATRGRVADSSAKGVGVEFVDPAGEVRLRIEALLETLVQDAGERRRSDRVRGFEDDSVAWEPDGVPKTGLGLWNRGPRRARLIDLSLDGAAILAKKPPQVGTDVRVYLEDVFREESGLPVLCKARVVRHTERGFAVQFLTPSTAFRRIVSELRRAARQARA